MRDKVMACPALRDKTGITDLRCKMLRAENVKFWGVQSKEMTGCPCKNMEEMAMEGNAKKTSKRIGECQSPTCDKVNVPLYACHGQDLCGGCKNKFYKPGKPKVYDTPAETEQIIIRFLDETDAEILTFLRSESRRCRRSIDQQVMWSLQSLVEGAKQKGVP